MSAKKRVIKNKLGAKPEPINVINTETKTVKRFTSRSEAATFFAVNPATISRHIKSEELFKDKFKIEKL